MTPRAVFACATFGLLVIGTAGACDRIQPASSGLVTGAPPTGDAAGGDDAQPPAYEASAGDGAYDAPVYTPVDADLAACNGCVCAKDTSYCFGGATLRAEPTPTPAAGTDGGDAGDSGPPVCATAGGATASIGCNTLPAACAAKPTCACLLEALQPLYRCYLNCADDGNKWLVYCPS